MSVPFEGAVSWGTVGSASVGPAAPAASTFSPWLEASAILCPGPLFDARFAAGLGLDLLRQTLSEAVG